MAVSNRKCLLFYFCPRFRYKIYSCVEIYVTNSKTFHLQLFSIFVTPSRLRPTKGSCENCIFSIGRSET